MRHISLINKKTLETPSSTPPPTTTKRLSCAFICIDESFSMALRVKGLKVNFHQSTKMVCHPEIGIWIQLWLVFSSPYFVTNDKNHYVLVVHYQVIKSTKILFSTHIPECQNLWKSHDLNFWNILHQFFG